MIKYKIVENGCWECTSHCTNDVGYVKVHNKGKQESGHRYMYRKYYGDIPQGKVVRHKCDNRWCVNPNHLSIGTHADNVKDRVKRNRSAIGVNNGRSKLKELEVLEIFKDNTTPKMQLARKFNIDPKVVRDIKQRKTWKHITK